MENITITQSSLEDFLSADGQVTGQKLAQRMSRYCEFIQNRLPGYIVRYGETNGTDKVPESLDYDEYAAVADLAGNSLDIICDGRRSLK